MGHLHNSMIKAKLEGSTECHEAKKRFLTQSGAEQRAERGLYGDISLEANSWNHLHDGALLPPSMGLFSASVLSLSCTLLVALSSSPVPPLAGSPSLNLSEFG